MARIPVLALLAALTLGVAAVPAAAQDEDPGSLTVEGRINACTIRFEVPAGYLSSFTCSDDSVPAVDKVRVSLTMANDAVPKLGTFEASFSESYILLVPDREGGDEGVWTAEGDDPDITGVLDPKGTWTMIITTDFCRDLESATLTLLPGCEKTD